jgi:hypothetical protein
MFWFAWEKDKVQKWKANNVFNTETMLPISEIRWETIILKDGGIRAILRLTGVNLDLRNYDEQEVIAEQYKKFLNGLDFPIQILVRNTYLELSDFITYVQGYTTKITSDSLLRWQADSYVSFLDQINAKQWLIYIKEFYLIIPYYPMENDVGSIRKPWWVKFLDAFNKNETAEKIVGRYRSFLKNEKFLETRVNVVIEWLKWVGIYGERLALNELISLMFKVYNPDAHKDQANRVE